MVFLLDSRASYIFTEMGRMKSAGSGDIEALKLELQKEYLDKVQALELVIKQQQDQISIMNATCPMTQTLSQAEQSTSPKTAAPSNPAAVAADIKTETPAVAAETPAPASTSHAPELGEEVVGVVADSYAGQKEGEKRPQAAAKAEKPEKDPKPNSAPTEPEAEQIATHGKASHEDVKGQMAAQRQLEKAEKLAKQQEDMLKQAEKAEKGDDHVKAEEHGAEKKEGKKQDGENHNAPHAKEKPKKKPQSHQKHVPTPEELEKAAKEKEKAHKLLMKQVLLHDNTPVSVFKTLPSSSVWCNGDSRSNRICRFRNLCYAPREDSWFILQTNRSVQHNVPLHRYHSGLLEMGTVANHPFFYWNFVEVSPFNPKFQNVKVRYEEKMHFIFRRLHPHNIMHNLHDDALGMYFVLKEYMGQGSHEQDMPFSLHTHRLLIFDKYGESASTRPFKYLSNDPIRYGGYIKQDEDVITCFRDAVVGNSKLTTWYQYGFQIPQGPIPGKTPNGMHVREVAEWYTRRIGIPLGEDEDVHRLVNHPHQNGAAVPSAVPDKSVDFPDTDLIVIMSRKGNRLIVNEEELAAHLTATFGLPTQFVRNEDHKFEEQVAFLRRARILVGMHGSILVMGMFCRRGTVLIEMYPFGVPSDHYTPYKTMANLPGMALVYRAYETPNQTLSIPHPDRHRLLGGLGHLSPEVRKKVIETPTVPQHLCCSDPHWLYRIYQDTIVDLPLITSLIKSALHESRSMLAAYRYKNWEETDLLPPTVKEIRCLDGPLRKPGELWAEWDLPWTGAKVEKWNILISSGKHNGREYAGDGGMPRLAIGGFEDGETVTFWIRPIVGQFKGEWGARGKCTV
ncbi:Protein O-linked-mannose beta-1,4-N-acetylglucosaminyltransferase 2 [Borealophlyctis nickersoniae]|nr:Protein O-linked-mannose beta-1,4-N-acetylglucosaminyltransferase 2 [Borealophlyctis nickersoniae]